MKKFIVLLLFSLICSDASAIIIQDVKMPLPVEYRLGTSDEIEKKYEVIDTDLVSTDALLQKEKDYFTDEKQNLVKRIKKEEEVYG